MNDRKEFTATLTRGNVYYLGNLRFDNGVPKPVTRQQRDHLESAAIDRLNSGREVFEKQKFDFEALPGRGEENVEEKWKAQEPPAPTTDSTEPTKTPEGGSDGQSGGKPARKRRQSAS